MEAVIQSRWSERDETIQQWGENVMMRINHDTESPESHEATEADTEGTEPDPWTMQSVGEHQ
jgi:hypothetical protein